MDSSHFLLFADACQALIVPICMSAYLPQWTSIISSRSSANVSARAYGIWTFSGCLGVFYASVQVAVYGTGGLLLVTSIVNLACLLTTMFLILKYRPHSDARTTAALVRVVGDVESARDVVDSITARSASIADEENHRVDHEREASAPFISPASDSAIYPT